MKRAIVATALASMVSLFALGGAAGAASVACPSRLGGLQLDSPSSGRLSTAGQIVQNPAGAPGNMLAGCMYLTTGFDPLRGLSGGDGPSVGVGWREQPGNDAQSVLECPGAQPPGDPLTFVFSTSRRAFAYYSADGHPELATQLRSLATALLAQVEPQALACAATATRTATATPLPSATARVTQGAIDIRLTGAVTAHLTQLIEAPRCQTSVQAEDSRYLRFRAVLDGTVYALEITSNFGRRLIAGSGTAAAGAAVNLVVGDRTWYSGQAGPSSAGTVTLERDLSGSLEVKLGREAIAGRDLVGVEGTFSCGGVVVPPAGRVAATSGTEPNDGGGLDIPALFSALGIDPSSLGLDPDTVKAILDAADDAGNALPPALIAIITAVIAGGAGPGAGGMAAGITRVISDEDERRGGPGDETATVPMPIRAPGSTLIDPDTDKPFTAWDPGKFAADSTGRVGQPGDLWWDGDGGHWYPRERVELELGRMHAATIQRRDEIADHQEAVQEMEGRAEQHHATERADEDFQRAQQDAARRALELINQSAIKHGDAYDDIYQATLDRAYRPDGSIDAGYVRGLRDVLRDRLVGDIVAPPETLRQGDLFTDFVDHSMADALRNPLIRGGLAVFTLGTSEIPIQVGQIVLQRLEILPETANARPEGLTRVALGVVSGGKSEMGFAVRDAHDAMRDAEADAAEHGRPYGYTDALRAGYSNLSHQVVPRNLYDLYRRASDPTKPMPTTSEIVVAAGTDVLNTAGLRSMGHEAVDLGAQARQAYRNWRNPLPVINADPRDLTLRPADPTTLPGLGENAPARWGRPPEGDGWRVGGKPLRPDQPLPETAGPAHRLAPEQREELRGQLDPASPPIGLKGMKPGAEIGARDAGIAPSTLRRHEEFLDTHPGVEAGFRPTSDLSQQRAAQGDLFKPPDLHVKTGNSIDEVLGMPSTFKARAVLFKPIPEDEMRQALVGRSPGEIVAIQDRWRQRMAEWNDLNGSMREKVQSGRFSIDPTGFNNGGGAIVLGRPSAGQPRTYFTGDNDLMFLRYRDPATGQIAQMPDGWDQDYLAHMKGHGVEHLDENSWRWARDGSPTDVNNMNIHRAINESYQPPSAPDPSRSLVEEMRDRSGNPVAVVTPGKIRAEYASPDDVIATPVEPRGAGAGIESWRRERLRRPLGGA